MNKGLKQSTESTLPESESSAGSLMNKGLKRSLRALQSLLFVQPAP